MCPLLLPPFISSLSLCRSQLGKKHTQSEWTRQADAIHCTGWWYLSTLKDGCFCREGSRRKCLTHIGSSLKPQAHVAVRGEVGRVLSARAPRIQVDTSLALSKRCWGAGKHCIPMAKAIMLDVLCCFGDHTTLSPQI